MLLWVLTLVACAGQRATPQFPTPVLSSAVETLGVGDVIEVKVFREPELDRTFQVGSTGKIDFPLIGELSVIGKQPESIAEEIRGLLEGDYLKDPQVTVFVKQQNSRKVHVLGQVNKPGSFVFRSGMSIIEAITTAGGFTDLASTNSVGVTRVVSGNEIKLDVPVANIGRGKAKNFFLRPGDIVVVPEAVF